MAISYPTEGQFIPECQVLYEGDTPQLVHNNCVKNPGHTHFVPVSGLKMEDLPPDMRNEETMKFIQFISQLTVKIIVSYTSLERPDAYPGTDDPYPYSHLKGNRRVRRTGTGYIDPYFIFPERGPCPCCQCDQAKQRKDEYWVMYVYTALHVVYDISEAKKTTCQLCYTNNDEKEVNFNKVYGTEYDSTESSGVDGDRCGFWCVSHEKNLVDLLRLVHKELEQHKEELKQHEESRHLLRECPPFIISHPHGLCQQITFGKIVSQTIEKNALDSDMDTCAFKHKRVTCRLPLFPWSSYNHRGSRDPDDYDVINEITMTPGTEFSIPLTQAIPPHDAKYIVCIDYTKDKKLSTFPAGTHFHTDLHQGLFFPPEAEFVCNIYDMRYNEKDQPDSSFKYDVATCPGSSGARVCEGFSHSSYFHYEHVHSGGCKDGYNSSDIHRVGCTFFLERRHEDRTKRECRMLEELVGDQPENEVELDIEKMLEETEAPRKCCILL